MSENLFWQVVMRSKRSRGPWGLLFPVIILALAAYLFRPSDRGAPYDAYFDALNLELRAQGYGRPVVILDLDKLDANLDVMMNQIKPPRHYRVVDKSLPSLELVQYVMKKTGSTRVMSFHEPHLRYLVRELSADTDFLLGKPMPIAAAREFYQSLPAGTTNAVSKRIQWLVDDEERLREYLGLAETLQTKFRVNVEIDVGLHRGGVPDPGGLKAVLKFIAAHPKRLQFSGLMGYDGHLLHVPAIVRSKESVVQSELEDIVAKYEDFLAEAKSAYPAWFTQEVTLNGAGSKTYMLYAPEGPLNDLSAGSGALKPSAFSDFTLEKHVPAVFIAAPIIKALEGFHVPFLDAVAPLAAWYNPNWSQSFYLYGGNWSETLLAPAGLAPNGLTTSLPNENMFPNQNLVHGSPSTKLKNGDFVFYQPKQGDAILQFSKILILRNRKLVGEWSPFPDRL